MPKKQVALVLSGGSSLGSYIAGALDELLFAFAASGEYEIDIITGASAGATTAAIIAFGLLYRNGATALHDVWVDKIDMTDLLTPNLPRDEPLSLLDGSHLQELAEETLSWDNPTDSGIRAPFCASTLRLSMTLGNTSALPYVSSIEQPAAGRSEQFVQYRNAEQESFKLSEQVMPIDPIWKRISTVARASAAIPFVFPLVPLTRQSDDPLQYIQKPAFDGEGHFWYYDGGTFNNLPVGLAWHYIDNVGDLDNRVVVIVNPWRANLQMPDLAPARPNLWQYALGLLGAVDNEATAIQFQGDVILRSMQAQNPGDTSFNIPGVDGPPVELLRNVALVMSRANDTRLRGNHLHALGAFLDRRFREYDFRRGAADARLMASDVLKIAYEPKRTQDFYEPEKDLELGPDIEDYDILSTISSTRDPNRSVRQVFEDSVDGRIAALVSKWNPPGPNFITDEVIKHIIHDELAKLWLL